MSASTENCTIENTPAITERIPQNINETKCPVYFMNTKDIKTCFELSDAHVIILLDKFLS